ncbi:MAG: nitroreductase family protein [Bacteroidales bacterium]|nr:nitroreductase family protein [Bacteroidales bacterium]
MSIPTSRTNEKGVIKINTLKCTGCGLCVTVCKDFGIVIKDGKAIVHGNSLFGCIGCGHCMAICPEGAIEISGRTISPDDLIELPSEESIADYNSIVSLMKTRRSIREFSDKEVSDEYIDKIIKAAQTAPMGLPPSDVHLLVLNRRHKVNAFAKDFCEHLSSMKWFVSGIVLNLMRPFVKRSDYLMFRDFIKPLIEIYTSEMNKGINFVTYDAPLVIYFYGSPYCDPADPLIAATYAMLAAESLGLGTCMLGAIHPFIQNGKSAQRFRDKYKIKYKSREGIVLIIGYSRIKYRKGIDRTFADVNYF